MFSSSRQDVHYQPKHPRGSSPNQEMDRGVGDRVERLRSLEQISGKSLTTLDESDGQQHAGQLAEPAAKLTVPLSGPKWQWDRAGRWI